MAKTAMQTLWDWIDANCHEDGFNLNDARDMSLKLEKEQIMKAFNDLNDDVSAKQYYNETYTQGNE